MTDPDAAHGDGTSLWEQGRAEDVGDGPARGRIRCDTLVVGAGITGATLALLLAEDGRDVTVVHGPTTGQTTVRSTAKVTVQHGLRYADLTREHGDAVARAYADAMSASLALVTDLVDRHHIECRLRRCPAVVAASEPHSVQRLVDEANAATAIGIDARITAHAGGPLEHRLAIEVPEQVELDPVAYTRGLLAAAHALGARVHPRTRALGVEERGDRVTVETDGAVVEADRVVLATLFPAVDTGGFFARLHAVRAPVVALEHDGALRGSYLYLDHDVRSVRSAVLPDGGHAAVAVGPSEGAPWRRGSEAQLDDLERRARTALGGGARIARWTAHDYESVDGLPVVGRAPRRSRASIAGGFAKWGFTHGTAAAMLLADRPFASHTEWGRVVDPGRLPGAVELARTATRSGPVALRNVLDVASGVASGVASRARGGDDDRGNPRCSHMGCTTAWNEVERTWDCPCHGSRFSSDGAVLAGPARRPIDPGRR